MQYIKDAGRTLTAFRSSAGKIHVALLNTSTGLMIGKRVTGRNSA